MKNYENVKIKRKLKWYIKLILYIVLIVLYSFFIGTKGIFIKDYVINSKKVTNQMHGLKIVQFSDLHYGSSTNHKLTLSLVKKINETKPDIVIFSGDLINKGYDLEKNEKTKIIDVLKNIKSTYGNYYTIGEEDNDESIKILDDANFINISEKSEIIYQKDSSEILITGIMANDLCKYDNNDSFKILVIHDPDEIDELDNCNFDIAMAGHTHNGQINIYKLKDFLIKSKYKNNYQKVNKTKLFINPGIGTSKINVRLFNHPTIYLYRLNKA